MLHDTDDDALVLGKCCVVAALSDAVPTFSLFTFDQNIVMHRIPGILRGKHAGIFDERVADISFTCSI